MQHYRPFEKPWYVQRSEENNPLITLNTGLEDKVDAYSDSNQNKNNISGKLLKGFIGTLSGIYILVQTACGGPSITPESSQQPPKKQEQTTSQSPIITIESTYKVIFPYKEPSSSLEEYVLEKTNGVTYMKFVRKKEDVKWAISLADLVNQSWSPLAWKDFIEKTISNELTPYIPLEDIQTFQQSQPHYQGTRNVDSSGNPIIAEPRYFQQTATRELIPIQEPDMVKQIFEELKAKFLAEEKVYEQSKIVFESRRGGGKYEIYIMNADGSEQKNLTNNPASDISPARSPDGKKIAFLSDRDGNYEIYVMNADGSGLERLTDNAIPASIPPVWSPDGEKIAFLSDRGRNFGEIYVMNANGSGLERLTDYAYYSHFDVSLAWSPDGKKIASTSLRDRSSEIYIMNADGSEQKNLTNNPDSDSFPAWSPDGEKIAFVSYRDGNYEIYVMNVNGSGLERLTNNPATDGPPVWSPDGKKIAFLSDRDGNREIYVMNADGSEQKNLTNNPDSDSFPVWSPDGKKIAFQSYRDGNYEIYVMNADGSELKRLTKNSGEDGFPSWPTFLSK